MPYSVRSRRPRDRRAAYYDSGRKARSSAISAARLRPGAMNSAQRGLQLAPTEFKAVDVSSVLDVNTTGSLILLNGMRRGDDINERIGREVLLKSILFKGALYVVPGTGIDQICRVMLVYDRQTNASALTVAQVLSSVTYLAPKNLENRKRFSILYDRQFALNADGESGSIRSLKFYRRLNHPVEFNSVDGGTVADITTGSFYLVVVGSVAAGTTAAGLNFSSRIRYTDK